jgi:hypothetical protein
MQFVFICVHSFVILRTPNSRDTLYHCSTWFAQSHTLVTDIFCERRIILRELVLNASNRPLLQRTTRCRQFNGAVRNSLLATAL